MKKITKNLIVLFLVFLLGSCFSVFSVRAQNNDLVLEVNKECNIQYAGNSCVAELKVTNNTGNVLDGEASLHIDYQGMCGDGFFDGEGIEAQFSAMGNSNWKSFSGWTNGTTKVSGFEIAKGESQSGLKIETVPNLCPGEYVFSLRLGASGYITPPIVIGGAGGGGTYYYYTINSSAGVNGSISPSGSQSIVSGGSRTYTISPNNGYQVADVLVDNVSKGVITTYTFSNISSAHTISATFSAVLSSTAPETGDVNGDGKVDEYDFSILMSQWGQTGNSICDFNNDGVVDEYDLAIMMANWAN